MLAKFIGNIIADTVDTVLQLIVEQVADHRHAALHPLPGTTKFGVVELSHGPIAVLDGEQHMSHPISGQTVPLCKILNKLDSSI